MTTTKFAWLQPQQCKVKTMEGDHVPLGMLQSSSEPKFEPELFELDQSSVQGTTSATPLPPFPPSLVAVANVVTATFVVAVVVPSAKPFAVVALQVARRTPHCGCVVVVVGLWVHKTCIGLLAAVVAMARVEVHLRQRGRWWQQR
ncbi:hypothetical protein EDB85DRAFT_1887624 [Lactarius pseudohatsudake]|nr:hypothetical protein EDB85DRAFT_1887624 [Lactarius pseudohatsudake]